MERYLEGRSVTAKPDRFGKALWKLAKRNKGASFATAAALLLLTTVVGVFLKFNHDARLEAEVARQQAEANYAAFQESVRKSAPAFVKSARLAAEHRDFEEASKQVAAALNADPHHPEARLLKAQLLIVSQEFAKARRELGEYLRLRAHDEAARRLHELCRHAQPNDPMSLVPLAVSLAEQEAWAMVDGLLRPYGKDSNEARQVLLNVFQRLVEERWPGKGNNLTIDARGLHLVIHKDEAITDLSPLRGVPLTTLDCSLTSVADLTPLKGMRLTALDCSRTKVVDLSPLRGMPLTSLKCWGTGVSDLSPLKGMRLGLLICRATSVADLEPLRGMPLTYIDCSYTQVSDLAPLQGMPLTVLGCNGTRVNDLTPVQGMPLTILRCSNAPITDLTPLAGMKLQELRFTPRNISRGLEVVRNMSSLKVIGVSEAPGQIWPAAEFWKRYDAGEFR
ncbi:MAG: tetratricopeptide repeat protein [Gemmataceae bacterium]|nr:tetratricopeptide repeat protein [Gemmataceae bacterium]